MQRSDLPNVAPTFTGSAGTVNVTSANSVLHDGSSVEGGVSGGSGAGDAIIAAAYGSITSFGSFTPSGTIQSLNGGVSQTAMKVMPPAIIVPYLIRII